MLVRELHRWMQIMAIKRDRRSFGNGLRIWEAWRAGTWSLMRKLLHERLEWPDTYATSITRHTTLV